MADSYSVKITNARVMADALKQNTGAVTKVDQAFVTEFEIIKDRAEALNTEQEKLKADLKAKSAELDAEMKSLTERYNFVKKRVKMDIPQAQWKEYGIGDSK